MNFTVVLTVLGAVIAALQLVLAYLANKQVTIAETSRVAAEKAAHEAAAQQRREAEAAAEERRRVAASLAAERQREQDKRFAVAIVDPLFGRDVQLVLEQTSPDEADLGYLERLWVFTNEKAKVLLSDELQQDAEVAGPMRLAMTPVEEFLRCHRRKVDSSGVDAKLGGADRTRYAWQGEAPLSKIRVINRIAERWAHDHGLTARHAFEESFGHELQRAVPARASEFDAALLLTDKAESWQPDLGLTLDGTQYGIGWRCGFRQRAKIGTELHKPVIEHFARVHGYDVHPL